MKRRYILTYLTMFGLAWLGYRSLAGAQQPLTLPPEPGSGLPVPAAVFSAEPPLAAAEPAKLVADFAHPAAKQEASVAFEWSGPVSVRVGQPNSYGLIVRNTSTIPVQQVVVR